MQATKKITLVIVVLMLSVIACANFPEGEIISSEEATQRAMPTATVELLEISGSEFLVGDPAVVIGGRYGALVPLFGNPGDAFFSSQVLHGTYVTVLGLQQLEDVIWYRVEGMMGEGWLLGDNLVTEEDYLILEAERDGNSAESDDSSSDDSGDSGTPEGSSGE
ncbi:MAG: hypothetical protein OEV06_02875 [Anaerolineae bacterium]|nr:hypothetical protein [Anaerolineae bacterium]